MRSEVREKQRRVKPKYPCLKRFEYPDGGEFVVLFTKGNTGIVVHSTTSRRTVGAYSDEWYEKAYMSFDGEVILSND